MTSPRRRIATLHSLARVVSGSDSPLTPSSWDDVVALTDELGIGPAVWRAIRDRQDPPAWAAEALHERYRANALRNARLRHQLCEAVHALNEEGIEPLLFKGSLQLIDGSLETIGDRWMEDLDLAVVESELDGATRALIGIGYRCAQGKPFRHPHEIPFFRLRSAGPIEVHVELGSPPIPSVLPVADAWSASSALSVPDAHMRALSPTHQVLHNVLHSSVQDFNHAIRGLPLRQLLILSILLRAHGEAIDWSEVRGRMAEHGLESELQEYLWLAHRFGGAPLPDGDWVRPSPLHNALVLAVFALGWAADVQRNLRYAFGRAYLDSLYNHGNRPMRLAMARVRHALTVVRRERRAALDQALVRKV